jgi:Zn-dependent protease with chaperone function
VITTLGLAVLAVAVFAWYAPRRAHVLPPRTATYLLTAGAVIATGVVVGVLTLAASTAVAQLPPVAAAGEWSRPDLRSTDPVPVWLALCCCALAVAAAVHGLRQTVLRALAYVRLHRECRHLIPATADQPVIVLDSEHPEAYATPAGGGRILVTTGLLAALPADEQPVLLAHEAAHLRHRHVWWVLVADLCAQANPMLRKVARATVQATERWADEHAAATVGDRELTARAVARAALHVSSSGTGRRSPRTAAVGGQIPQRVHALLVPPPRPRRALTAGLILLLVASLGCALAMQRRTDAFFDLASSEKPTAVNTQPIDRPPLPATTPR